jgi:hypothetical protein
MYSENEELQVEKLKELKGESKPPRKPPKKKEHQLFDMKKPKSNKKVKKKY